MTYLDSLYSDIPEYNPVQRNSLASHGNSGGAAKIHISGVRICQRDIIGAL